MQSRLKLISTADPTVKQLIKKVTNTCICNQLFIAITTCGQDVNTMTPLASLESVPELMGVFAFYVRQ